MKTTIGNIDFSAPLWRGATPEQLHAIVKLFSDASYHYADDTAKEWGKAHEKMKEAAAEINKFRLDHSAIGALYSESRQLFSLPDLIDFILRDARK